jgi:hypothetical protein
VVPGLVTIAYAGSTGVGSSPPRSRQDRRNTYGSPARTPRRSRDRARVPLYRRVDVRRLRRNLCAIPPSAPVLPPRTRARRDTRRLRLDERRHDTATRTRRHRTETRARRRRRGARRRRWDRADRTHRHGNGICTSTKTLRRGPPRARSSSPCPAHAPPRRPPARRTAARTPPCSPRLSPTRLLSAPVAKQPDPGAGRSAGHPRRRESDVHTDAGRRRRVTARARQCRAIERERRIVVLHQNDEAAERQRRCVRLPGMCDGRRFEGVLRTQHASLVRQTACSSSCSSCFPSSHSRTPSLPTAQRPSPSRTRCSRPEGDGTPHPLRGRGRRQLRCVWAHRPDGSIDVYRTGFGATARVQDVPWSGCLRPLHRISGRTAAWTRSR